MSLALAQVCVGLACAALASPAAAQLGPAESATLAALARISAVDRAGPKLNSVLAVNPAALADARALDAKPAGALHGMVVVIKDNIDAAGMATTVGSLAMVGNIAAADAPVTARLRGAGAVILGKANLSEWANFRSTHSISGWSAVGGLTLNPYALTHTACGSSSGSAVAVAAEIAVAAIGTETDGSITCPAAANGLVGLKPTLGLISRTGIAPISPEQDTAGPIARNVRDLAAVLTVIAGADEADPATSPADGRKIDYVAALDPQSLKGVKIGVLRGLTEASAPLDAVFNQALEDLKGAGAILVEVAPPMALFQQGLDAAESDALRAEFKAAINAYLAKAPAAVKTRTLADLIAFNAATPAETARFGQELFEEVEKRSWLPEEYRGARAVAQRLARRNGLDGMFTRAGVEVIVAPSGGPAEPIESRRYAGSPSTYPAVAGYPHLTVPMGLVGDLPVGLSFIGPAWSDARILSLGYAYEQATKRRVAPKLP